MSDVPTLHSATQEIEIEAICKNFNGVSALVDITLKMTNTEVLGLAGGNGSGKSTLLKIIAGALCADSGTVALNGIHLKNGDVRQAKSSGIQMLFQDSALCLDVSALENLFLGSERVSMLGFLKFREMKKLADEVIARYELPIPSLVAFPREMSGGERKAIGIARALLSRPRFLLLDEPTAALGVKEQLSLLRIVRELQSNGVGVIVCTHSPDELLGIASRVVILKQGKIVVDKPTAKLSKEELIMKMSS
jgi:ABC-type sugar transport system ATPase subunit